MEEIASMQAFAGIMWNVDKNRVRLSIAHEFGWWACMGIEEARIKMWADYRTIVRSADPMNNYELQVVVFGK